MGSLMGSTLYNVVSTMVYFSAWLFNVMAYCYAPFLLVIAKILHLLRSNYVFQKNPPISRPKFGPNGYPPAPKNSITRVLLISQVTLLIYGAPRMIPPTGRKWCGWHGIDTCGDSYSSTGFEVSGAQPNRNNSFGNPANIGEGTTCDGRNWVNWLAATYNESFIKTYDIAWEASTVDWSRLEAYRRPYSNDFIGQLENKFVDHFVHSCWNSSTTLFSMFFGINDIYQIYQRDDRSAAMAAIFDGYKGLVDELYHFGARIFLLLEVPPLDRSPETKNKTGEAAMLHDSIIDWNKRLKQMTMNFSANYLDTTVFLFETNKLFSDILDDPTSHNETAELANTTNYCEIYKRKLFHPDPPVPQTHFYDSSCGVRIDEYFWIDDSHPTWPVHRAMAAEIFKLLQAGPLDK